MSVNRILRDKNPLLPLVRTLSEKCTWIHGHLVVANKKKDDQLYYHSCGEPCCSGWGATPELQNNNNDKIILGTPKNKIVINLQKEGLQTWRYYSFGLLFSGAEHISVSSSTVDMQLFFFSYADPLPLGADIKLELHACMLQQARRKRNNSF